MRQPVPYFDAHCDTVAACAPGGASLRKNSGHLDLERLAAFSPAGQVFALYADAARFPAGTLFAVCRQMRAYFRAELQKNADILAFCPMGHGLREAAAAGRIAAVLSIEGGELLNCDPALLETAAQWGVRCITLTWNHANALAGAHADAPDRGLSPRGRAWVRECRRLGILPDVSHLSDAAFWDIAELAEGPILASHSNSRAICPHSRNLTDDMFRAICQSGGAVGLNFWLDFVGGDHSMDALIRHIDHFMELGGEKHLALGGDMDGCSALAGGLRGAEDIPLLWAALQDRGYAEATLEDIFYNNLLRVLGG